jgi:hypothetical protein
MKKYLVFLLVFFLALSVIIGCSKDEDENARSTQAEQTDAALMATGLASLTGDLGTYDDYVGVSSAFRGPPPGWFGPESFTTPDGSTSDWYWFEIGTQDDTLLTLLMQTPDSWEDTTITWVNEVEIWLWYQVENTVWFNFALSIASDTTSIDGYWKWNYQDTWLEYEITEMSIVYLDYSGQIDISTSSNINLSASFTFETDGSGTGTGRWQGIEFVRYTFYEMPPEPNRGFYTLLSEHWEVEHLF